MAGNPGSSDKPDTSKDSESNSGQTPSSNAPKVKTFSCPNCGASVTVRHPGQSLSCVCDSCRSIIDTTNNEFEIISQYYKNYSNEEPLFELGTRGQLFEKTWEVIGFMVRRDEASSFSWEEYLLFNPYHGYRWLTYNNGHFNFVTPLKEKPIVKGKRAEFENKTFNVFYQGRACVIYVIGEFYWKVSVGSSVFMSDYICPPEMLSSEEDNNESTWSKSEYVEASVIKKAFKLQRNLAYRVGVAPNQPSGAAASMRKIGPLWGIFVIILTVVQFGHLTFAHDKTIVQADYPFTTNSKSTDSLTTPVFFVDQGSANLKVTFDAPVDNSWLYLAGELVNDKTGETYPFERTVEYYHGVDGGESWTEGGLKSSFLVSALPGGPYYMNIDYESGGFSGQMETHYSVRVQRDVRTFANYFWCLLAISLLPIFSWFRARSFEVARWQDSDFSPYRTDE